MSIKLKANKFTQKYQVELLFLFVFLLSGFAILFAAKMSSELTKDEPKIVCTCKNL